MKRLSVIILISLISGFFFSSCSEENILDSGNEENIHSSNITQNETWEKGTHYIDGFISVSNAILTIEPGAMIVFRENGRLIIGENGGLIADGTAETITFTGEQKQNGYWHYIEFSGSAVSAQCIMKNVIIEYGGGYSTNSYMLRIKNNATVMNCTIRNSSSNGVEIDQNISPTFVNNVITSNAGFPVLLDFTSCNCLQLGTGSLKGNGKDYVLLDSRTLTQDARLHFIDVPYRFDGVFQIDAPATLIIDGGNVCEMNSGSRIYVWDGAGLVAIGNETLPIVFTGAVKQSGYWDFIEFSGNANNANSRLEYVTIEYGGGYSQNSAQLFIKNDATIKNSTIQYSSSYGCIIEENAIPVFMNNILTGNTKAPLYVDISNVGRMDLRTCDFTGNMEAFIYVEDGSATPNSVLQKTNVPYLFDGGFWIENNNTFTIEPGTIIQMASGSYISVFGGATFVADGTNEVITITGQIAQKGYWYYIEFDSDASNQSKLINCVVEYGGGYSDNSGLILLKNTSTIQGCTIQHSSSNGINVYTSTGNDQNVSGNTFNDIDGMNIFYF